MATPEVKFSAPSPDEGLLMKAHLARTSVYRFQPKMAITMRLARLHVRKELRTQQTYRGEGGGGGGGGVNKKTKNEGGATHESGD